MNCFMLKNNIINDKDFLKAMIIHHQVAIDMSKLISKSSSNNIILEKARNMIFNQTNEVNYMKTLYIDTKYSINEVNTKNKPLISTFETEYPIIYKNLKCDETHFKLDHHTNHNMSDLEYLKHMISHHNTALELSKLVIVSTKNSQILALAHIINLSQSKEIFELYFLEKSLKTNLHNFIYFK